MSNKKIIKQILREETSSWSNDTKSFSALDKGQQRFAEVILKRRHRALVQYIQKRREEDGHYDSGYSEDYDEFILGLKNTFPNYSDFGHIIQTTMKNDNPIITGMDMLHMVRVVSEYIVNYGDVDSHERVDVVPSEDLLDYVNEQFFDCSNNFFETVWDKILVGRSNRWNEEIKDRMWEEIKDEVESKMSDDEGEEYSEFDGDIEKEEGYFHTYWYYPIQSLGWDEFSLCEFYRDYLNPQDFVEYFFNSEEINKGTNKDWDKLPLLDNGDVFIIKRNKLFY